MLAKRMHSLPEITGLLHMLQLSFFNWANAVMQVLFRGQRGQIPLGLGSWHKRWEQKTLKFRGSPLNTDARWCSSCLYGLWQEPDPQLAELQPQTRLQLYYCIYWFIFISQQVWGRIEHTKPKRGSKTIKSKTVCHKNILMHLHAHECCPILIVQTVAKLPTLVHAHALPPPISTSWLLLECPRHYRISILWGGK